MYFFKAFYNKMNKKMYNLQISQYNMYYTNVVVIKDVIILKKARRKEKLSKLISIITATVEMTWKSNLVHFDERYK